MTIKIRLTLYHAFHPESMPFIDPIPRPVFASFAGLAPGGAAVYSDGIGKLMQDVTLGYAHYFNVLRSCGDDVFR